MSAFKKKIVSDELGNFTDVFVHIITSVLNVIVIFILNQEQLFSQSSENTILYSEYLSTVAWHATVEMNVL